MSAARRSALRPRWITGSGTGTAASSRMGVVGLRVQEGRSGGALLLDPAAPQHHDALREVLYDGEVVGDEETGEAQLVLELGDHFEHRLLHAHVERAGGLVGDQQPGFEYQGAGQADPLALTARQLAGCAPREVTRQPDPVEDGGDLAPAVLGGEATAVHPERLGDALADRHPGVQ